MKRLFILIAALSALLSCSRTLKDGDYTLTVLSTNDVHGTWFDSTYVGGRVKKSVFAINHYVDSVRKADGLENVLLIDAGDCLQGDNAAYYYNFVDTTSTHLFSRIMEYMKYDAIAMGNHDVETGHPVYDRVQKELLKGGTEFLAGNAVKNDGSGTYFPLYKVVKKAGLKIAVLGYTNANIKAWLSEELWSGMHFVSIADIIQRDVDFVRAKEKPDVLVASMHSACGKGDGTILEAEALDAFNSVQGVDWLICGHDHIPYVETRENSALLNSGSHSRYLAHGKMHLKVEGGKIVSKTFETDLIPVDATKADPVMREKFRSDFEAVKAFTVQKVGTLATDLRTRDSYAGQSDYMNLIHYITMSRPDVEISIAAPLTFNSTIKSGDLLYNDLFTIYPFENQLYVVTMTGEELVRYLEASYDRWIVTPGQHVLRLRAGDNRRTGERRYSFENAFFNFDSAGGINYTVDVTKPRGSRIHVYSMANGEPFDPDRTYNVGMTSYRASGGGDLLKEIGIESEEIDRRIVNRYPEIRSLIYDSITEHKEMDPRACVATVGTWQFVPEKARKLLDADMKLLFERY